MRRLFLLILPSLICGCAPGWQQRELHLRLGGAESGFSLRSAEEDASGEEIQITEDESGEMLIGGEGTFTPLLESAGESEAMLQEATLEATLEALNLWRATPTHCEQDNTQVDTMGAARPLRYSLTLEELAVDEAVAFADERPSGEAITSILGPSERADGGLRWALLLASGTGSEEEVIAAWQSSPKHCELLHGAFQEIAWVSLTPDEDEPSRRIWTLVLGPRENVQE